MIDQLAIARYERADEWQDVKPLDALEKAKQWAEQHKANHVAVVLAQRGDGRETVYRVINGGDFSTFEAIGLLAQAQWELLQDREPAP